MTSQVVGKGRRETKTAVADGQWARVGSTNLNPSSWLGNWELDVAVENAAFAQAMEAMYVDDLRHATEIVLSRRRRVRPAVPTARRHAGERRGSRAAAAGAIGMGSLIGAAITNQRLLGPAEARVLASAGALLLVIAAAVVRWPRLSAVPVAVVAGWIAAALLLKAWTLHRAGRRR